MTRPAGDPGPASTRPPSLLLGAAVLLAVSPALIVLVRAAMSGWTPSGDQAMELVRMHDVGSRHTPLLGPYSRFGWDHPGPLLFWLGAPALRLAGPVGVMALVGLVNIGAVVGAIVAARRLAGDAFAFVVTVGTAVLIGTHGAVKLVDPWNPWVTVLPLLCYLLCVPVAVVHRSRWALAVAITAGSFVAQSHLGNLPVVLAAAGAGGVWWWSGRRRVPPPSRPAVPGPWFLVLLLALWSGPLIDLVVNRPGNLWDLAEFALDAPERPPALTDALGAAARELGFLPAWSGVAEGVWPVRSAPVWTLLVLPAALLLGLASWAGERAGAGRDRAPLVGYVLAVYVAAAFAVTRTTGGLIPYVLRWTWPVALVATAVALLPVIRALEGLAGRTGAVVRRAGAAGLGVLLVIAVTAAGIEGASGPVAPSPNTDRSAGALAAAIRAGLPAGTYGLQWYDVRSFSAVSIGAGVDLVRHGYDIDFPPDHATRLGEFRATGRLDVPLVIIVGQTPLQTWTAPTGARRIVRWDHLTEVERSRADELESRVRRDASVPAAALVAVDTAAARRRLVEAGARAADVEALHALEADRELYEVWLAPAGTPRPAGLRP